MVSQVHARRALIEQFGGGPEIPFFIVDTATNSEAESVVEDNQNRLMRKRYLNGFPDKHPVHPNLIISADGTELVKMKSIVSRYMTIKQLVFYYATRMNLHSTIDKFSVKVKK